MKTYKFFTTADVHSTNNVVEMKDLHKKVLASDASNIDKAIFNIPLDVNRWLPQASKVYHISKDINDYVVVPACIMLSDLPNRNGVAFPLQELLKFNTDTGDLAYKAWKGKPTFLEHKNNVLSEAKGVIFDAFVEDAPEFEGDLIKVILLLGFDKTKDPQLANDIITGKRTCYSMGAYSDDFVCSICGKTLSQGGCEHASINNPRFNIYDGKLGFYNVKDILPFETSSVETPAYIMCDNDKVIEISKVK